MVVHDYTAMDRILKEEKKYIVNLVKKIVATGCNVLLIQKSNDRFNIVFDFFHDAILV